MNVFVLGGTGFIGYHVVLELLRRGHGVTVLALDMPREGLLPVEVQFKLADFNACPDDEIRDALEGRDAVVFAMGVDDRVLPKAPAYEFFHTHNVAPVKRVFTLAREAGVKRGVVCGSYFAYFDRIWPACELARHHPYIRSRRDQAAAAIAAGGGAMEVCILELPYIFGSMPGRTPLWAPLLDYLRLPLPVLYTPGGTTMVSVKRVAEAVCGAAERGRTGCYPVGDEDLTWVEMIRRLTHLMGRKRVRIVILPRWVVKAFLALMLLYTALRGKESGLHPIRFADLQCTTTYIRPEDREGARRDLGFGGGDLMAAFGDTVAAAPPLHQRSARIKRLRDALESARLHVMRKLRR